MIWNNEEEDIPEKETTQKDCATQHDEEESTHDNFVEDTQEQSLQGRTRTRPMWMKDYVTDLRHVRPSAIC